MKPNHARIRQWSVGLVVTAALSLASCGGDDAAGPQEVGMKNLRFRPTQVAMKVGERVTWRNEDAADHNVVAIRGASFRSRAFGKGKTYSYVPERSGRISYVCTLHPQMRGRLDVKP